ncbi:MAG: flagellar assembly protein FliW [Chthoniobacteraceae bacterium]
MTTMTIESNAGQAAQLSSKAVYHFPTGLPGLPNLKECELLYNEAAYPLMWLHGLGDEPLRLPVVEPGPLVPGYEVEISDNDAEFLGIHASSPQPLVLVVLTVKSLKLQFATVNLMAPIVINQETFIGKQVILRAITMDATPWSIR